MSGWARKRFWKETQIVPDHGRYCVALDGRIVKTPAKQDLSLPTASLAQMIAREWDAQIEEIDPSAMPMTRIANAAIDKVGLHFDEIVAHLLEYTENDLLCYRAEAPQELRMRQAMSWDPVLKWMKQQYEVEFSITAGVMPVRQPDTLREVLYNRITVLTPFELAAFYDLVTLLGSFALALTAIETDATPDDIWKMAFLDAHWQEEQWGIDKDAKDHEERKKKDFDVALDFFVHARLCADPSSISDKTVLKNA